MSDFRERLTAKVSGFLVLSEEELIVLERHYELMKQWNRVLNLTRIEDLDAVVERHYGESLFLAAHLPKESLRIVDVGSGAGFPGFPVAVVRPDCEVTLVEAHHRKAVFLKEVSRGIAGVRVIGARAEEALVSDKRAGVCRFDDGVIPTRAEEALVGARPYDYMISRAVRWEDLRNLRLAKQWMVLTGTQVEGSRIQVPWGDSRFLVSGRFT